MCIYKLELRFRFFTLEWSSVAHCLFEAGTLNRFIGVSHRAHSQFHYNILKIVLHLKGNNLIEFFIVKLELIFVFGDNYYTCSRVLSYIYVYKNPGAKLPEASECLCELMHFYWKIFLFWKLFIYRPGPMPTRGAKTLSAGPGPGPMLATACRSVIFSNLIVPAGLIQRNTVM